jgi:inner membrane protein
MSERLPVRFWVLSVVCAMLPDIDVVGFAFGIRYEDMLGHRGLTHSLAFAFLVGCGAAWITLRESQQKKKWLAFVLYFFIVTASHGILDAMTNGGLGVAFFAPFSNTRYFFLWRPIEVSPLGLEVFFSSPLPVLGSEIKWIWIPSGVVIIAARMIWTLVEKRKVH